MLFWCLAFCICDMAPSQDLCCAARVVCMSECMCAFLCSVKAQLGS